MLIGIVPIYNLPGVHTELRFSGELLAGIFLGEVKAWNASQIAKLNPEASLPSLPIKVIYRPAGKGSNYVFSEFLSKTSSKFRTQIGISPSPNWPVGSGTWRLSMQSRPTSHMARYKTHLGSMSRLRRNDQGCLPRGRGAGVGQVFN